MPWEVWSVIGFVVVFPLLGCGVGLLLGSFGWRRLAAAYPDRPSATGERWGWRSMAIEWGPSYSNCVNFLVAQEGLRISLAALLRVGHPPIFIPWSDLQATPTTRWFFSFVRLEAALAPGVRLLIRPALAEKITPFLPQNAA